MGLLSIRSSQEDYYTLRAKEMCVKQVYFRRAQAVFERLLGIKCARSGKLL